MYSNSLRSAASWLDVMKEMPGNQDGETADVFVLSHECVNLGRGTMNTSNALLLLSSTSAQKTEEYKTKQRH